MKNKIEKTAGPMWGVAAGLLLAVAGLSLGIFSTSSPGSGSASDFMASGVAMLGIFLVVYSTHELRRQRAH
jgi:formate/nitrite transporter FocA (FNT family)